MLAPESVGRGVDGLKVHAQMGDAFLGKDGEDVVQQAGVQAVAPMLRQTVRAVHMAVAGPIGNEGFSRPDDFQIGAELPLLQCGEVSGVFLPG